MKIELEIERKFLIKLPLSEEAIKIVFENADAPAHIHQTYIKNLEGNTERIRTINVEMWGKLMPTHYSHTVKTHISPGVNKEVEIKISLCEYSNLLPKLCLKLNPIKKTRYYINWKERLFEFDIFHGVHEGLAILEIELIDMNEIIELPPFLEVIREVTEEIEYSNAFLAEKK